MEEALKATEWLWELPEATRNELFQVSLNFLKGEATRKFLIQVSEKLEKDQEVIESTIESLSFMITKCAAGFKGFDSLWNEELKEFCKEKTTELKEAVAQNALFNPLKGSLVNFDWRFEVKLAGRTAEEAQNPRLVLNFQTESGNHFIESDYANLQNLYDQLSCALKSFNSTLSKKADRFIKNSSALN